MPMIEQNYAPNLDIDQIFNDDSLEKMQLDPKTKNELQKLIDLKREAVENED